VADEGQAKHERQRAVMIGFAALLLAAAPAPTKAMLAGFYRTQQMEIAGPLELQRNGHFRYELEYGAVSEQGEGVWAFDGKTVRLTSSPMPRQPNFVLVGDRPAPACELSVSVDWGKLDWSAAPRVLVTYQGDPKIHLVYADGSGKLESSRCDATSIRPLVPVYGVVGSEVKLSLGEGRKLQFRFEPNDIGRAAFRREPLVVDGRGLVLTRYETSIRFIRTRP
jgi:hypothetical protein